MDGAQKSYLGAVALMVLALWCLVLAVLSALHYYRVDTIPAEAPIAAFSKTGDDRTLPPIFSGLAKSRHYLSIFLASRGTSSVLGASSEPSESPSFAPAIGYTDTAPRMPSLFVYGDSTVDVGNHNNLKTMAKAVLPPYGRDFDTHFPTGRFSNGRLTVDYLALYLGVPGYSLPFGPFLEVESMPSTIALNFASAGAGILPSRKDGDRISLHAQVQNMLDVLEKQSSHLGVEATSDLLANGIHYISFGSNEFIHGIPNDDFEFLTRNLSQVIEKLYTSGARKIVAVGIGPLGCSPAYISNRDCDDSVNFMAEKFNKALEISVARLALKHPKLKIVYCDIFFKLLLVTRNSSSYGFRNSRMACCGGGCMHSSMPCNDADDYVWWDQVHPTDKTNKIVADELWSGEACQPFNLEDLAGF